jgi:hypothetical protein
LKYHPVEIKQVLRPENSSKKLIFFIFSLEKLEKEGEGRL